MSKKNAKKTAKRLTLADLGVPIKLDSRGDSNMSDDSLLDMGNVAIVVSDLCPDGWSAQFKAQRGSGAQATAQVILEGPYGNKAAFPITTVGELKKVIRYFCREVTLVYKTNAWHEHASKVLLGAAHGLNEAYDIINEDLCENSEGQAVSLSVEEGEQLRTRKQTQTDGDRFDGEYVLESVNIHRRMRE